jgi:CubicO group peptidase (beta-lactamase class C family)
MSDQSRPDESRPGESRSLPDRPSLRFLKVEAKERLAAGEFATLHEAQLAIAREHGLPSWAALKEHIAERAGSPALEQVRWVVGRFAGADGPSWQPPDDDELGEHLEAGFLARVGPRLVSTFTSRAALLREDEIVLGSSPRAARVRVGGMQIEAMAEAEPPHRLVMLRAFPVASRVTDSRVAQPSSARSGDVPAEAERVAEEAFAELGLTGLVLAGDSWALARGWADLDRGEALRPEHRFPAWAVTKLVTATAVLALAGQGSVGLDEPACRYLRTVALADDAITVRELLTHTGGVDAAAAGPVLADTVLGCSGPRGEFRYSDGGYAALGQLIADVTGLGFAEAAGRLVLGPLGMTGAWFPDRWPGDEVTGYQLSESGAFEPAGGQVGGQVDAAPAAGGLWATGADLVRFGLAWASLLPGELAREALTPQADRATGQMGLGWVLNTDRGVAGHAGAGQGGGSSLIVRGGVVSVALTNRAVPIEPVNSRVNRAIT